MTILIKPSEIIERCLWNDYKKCLLSDYSELDIKTIIADNSAVSIPEDKAFAIGLLKVIETDNLVHKFNLHMLEILQIKSNIYEGILFINKNILIKDVNEFLTRFPDEYNFSANFKKSIDELKKYIADFISKVEKLKITVKNYNDVDYEFLNSNNVHKILPF